MGFFDYVSDLYSAVSIQPVEAEDARQFEGGPVDTSGNQNSGKDASNGGIGTAEQDRGATTQGGASLSSPAAGTDEESAEEADVNKEDAAKAASRQPEADKGHTPGESASSDDEEEEEEEEDEEEEDEPEDPKPRLEEECMKSQQCAPLKHHYDECAERVMKQQEETGKAEEDCVEEFFHLMHCASACAAPKLFRQLK